MNGDGFADIIIGAPLSNPTVGTDAGNAYVFHGFSTGLRTATIPAATTDADWFASGNVQDANFGKSVAPAGDVNGDVIVGAKGYDPSGAAFIFAGKDRFAGLDATHDLELLGNAASSVNSQFGSSVASAGDVNGDGYSDFIIGANKYSTTANAQEGGASVYHGSSEICEAGEGCSFVPPIAWQVHSTVAASNFGFSVSTAGDVNRDGYSDVIIGAPKYNVDPSTEEGRAFVYLGDALGLNKGISDSPADWTANGGSFGDRFGHSVALAGDVNGDGYADVVIGANRFDNFGSSDDGAAYVFHGGDAGLSLNDDWRVIGSASGDQFGSSVASAGDVNGDGFSDVIIGALSHDSATLFNTGPSHPLFWQQQRRFEPFTATGEYFRDSDWSSGSFRQRGRVQNIGESQQPLRSDGCVFSMTPRLLPSSRPAVGSPCPGTAQTKKT